jgi:hypothetical protein
MLASSLGFAVSLFVLFFIVLFLLHAALVDFIDDREPDATVRPCTRVINFLLEEHFKPSHVVAYRFPCVFPPCLTGMVHA